MADYLKNFKKNTKSSKVLEMNLNKSFDIVNFDNDLSFGCYSVGLDFDYTTNQNIKDLQNLKDEWDELTKRKEMYSEN